MNNNPTGLTIDTITTQEEASAAISKIADHFNIIGTWFNSEEMLDAMTDYSNLDEIGPRLMGGLQKEVFRAAYKPLKEGMSERGSDVLWAVSTNQVDKLENSSRFRIDLINEAGMVIESSPEFPNIEGASEWVEAREAERFVLVGDRGSLWGVGV